MSLAENAASVPPESDDATGAPAQDNAAGAPLRSLYDDFEALIDDARTYFDAELSYQKNRAGFVANRLKNGIVAALAALVIVIFALIGLTVGLIIALTPHVTAWGATAIVVGTLLLGAALLVRRAMIAFREMSAAMQPPAGEESDG